MEQLAELREYYDSPESDYLELAVNEDEVWDEAKDGAIPL